MLHCGQLDCPHAAARVRPASNWLGAYTMSGAQSLLSVYLLALAVLTYFGRPFE